MRAAPDANANGRGPNSYRMTDPATRLGEIAQRSEAALGTLEQDNRWEEALAIYHATGAEVDALTQGLSRKDPLYRPAKKLRAYLYLREGNALRALGRPAEAAPLAELELSAAMGTGEGLTIARAMFSLGTTCLVNGQQERGLKLIEQSKPMFEHVDDPEFKQGLGWWYLVQADLSAAGLVDSSPQYALECAHKAFTILRPLQNWPGVARAHAARAAAYDRLGDERAARVARSAEQMALALLNQRGDKKNGAD